MTTMVTTTTLRSFFDTVCVSPSWQNVTETYITYNHLNGNESVPEFGDKPLFDRSFSIGVRCYLYPSLLAAKNLFFSHPHNYNDPRSILYA